MNDQQAIELIFDPENPAELVKGWVLHAAKARRKHEEAARGLDRLRYWIGVPAIAISAIVGASIIGSLEAQFGAWVTIAVGLGGIVASMLASLQTFLAYAELAEKHRAAGVEYKAAVRRLEERLAGRRPEGALSCDDAELKDWLENTRDSLDILERKAPIVPDRIHKRVEGREFRTFKFAPKAEDLRRGPV
jgi:hypothetical protein